MAFGFCRQRNRHDGNAIAEKLAQPRLSITHQYHGGDVYHVFAIAKTWQRFV